MAQYIKQGDIFGRLGAGIGKGLSEQVPKEIERARLSSGLRELGQKQGLTPFQQFAELSGLPGVTPQMIQSGSELLRQQGQREAFSRPKVSSSIGAQPSSNLSKGLDSVDFANLNKRSSPSQDIASPIPQGNFPSGEPQIVEKNPLSPEMQPAIPWTPERRDEEIGRVWDQNPYLTFQEVQNRVEDNERRYLESPQAYQQQQEHLKKIQEDVNTEIDSQLRKKLQIPKDQELFGDKISGESINRIQRGVSRDLRKNPDSNVNDLVNTWTDLALQNDKDKVELTSLANRPWDEKILPIKKAETLSKIKSFSKNFKKFGNSEELYNKLKSDFKLSPEGASALAYELSNQAKDYISKIKPSTGLNYYQNTIKHAQNLKDYLTREDSVLSVAKHIKEKDPFFDLRTFLQEARSIQQELGLSGTQINQMNARGVEDFFPNWGDLSLFPRMGRGL